MTTYQEHFDASSTLRNDFWQSVGTVDPYVIAHLLNPAFTGGPAWPSTRQAFITIRTQDSTMIASDGLSDPYTDMETTPQNAKYNGFGLEVYVATGKLPERVQNTWQFQLLYQAAQLVAEQGNLVNLLEEMTYLTSELYNVDVPGELSTKTGAWVSYWVSLTQPFLVLCLSRWSRSGLSM